MKVGLLWGRERRGCWLSRRVDYWRLAQDMRQIRRRDVGCYSGVAGDRGLLSDDFLGCRLGFFAILHRVAL